jgi:hypothetical protein
MWREKNGRKLYLMLCNKKWLKNSMESSALFLFVCIDFYEGRENSSFSVDVEY